MSETSNTFGTLQPMFKEDYASKPAIAGEKPKYKKLKKILKPKAK